MNKNKQKKNYFSKVLFSNIYSFERLSEQNMTTKREVDTHFSKVSLYFKFGIWLHNLTDIE